MHVGATPPSPAKISVPFPVLAGLNEVVWHPAWVLAFTAVRAGLHAATPVVLTGGPGLGKSLLLKALEHALRQEGQTVVLLPGSNGEPARPDVVLLDEADRVPLPLLKHLVGTAPRCVLVGPHTLLDTLAGLAATPTVVEMRPLRDSEVEPYLLEQIERAGLPDALLGPGTFDAIVRHGEGNPRRLQKLASRALFQAWIDNADQVSAAHVAEAVAQDDPAAPSAADEPVAEAPHPPGSGNGEPVAAAYEPMLAGSPLVLAPYYPARPGLASWTRSRLRRHPWAAAFGVIALCSAAAAVLTVWPDEPRTAAPLPPQAMASPDVVPTADPPLAAPSVAPPAEGGSAPSPANTLTARTEPAVVAPDAVAPGLAVPQGTAQDSAPPKPLVPDAAVAAVETAAPPIQAAPVVPEPPSVVPTPSLPRPSAVPVHVVVAAAPSAAAAGNLGVTLVGALKGAGMDAVLAVGPISEPGRNVQYFYAADQPAAAQVARRIGEAGRERLATVHGTPPRPGTIYVVIRSRHLSAGRPSNPTRPTEEKKAP